MAESNRAESVALKWRPEVAATLVAVAWLAISIASVWRYRGPELNRGESATRLSGTRLEENLALLVGDGTPRPAGSPQREAARDRIIEWARDLGYEVEIHACSNHIRRQPNLPVVPLENILFRWPGTAVGEANRPVMLAAHYDSSPSGPGAADDGAGVAVVLEAARRVRDLPPFRHDIVFLLTDGEEYGLLGAERFVTEHPWAGEISAVINLEARGTSGSSLMFQTSKDNAWLVKLFSQTVSRPATSSLFYEVYRYLPNDTDFTIFHRGGMEGFNFAFIGDVVNYHTENDSLQMISRRSLQHHADNAWPLLLALANFDWSERVPGRIVYFDLFQSAIVYWPESWSLYIALILAAGVVALPMRGGDARPGLLPRLASLATDGLWAAGGLIASALIVFASFQMLRLTPPLALPWPASPWALVASFYLLAMLMFVGWVELAARLNPQASFLAGTLLLWAGLAVLLSYLTAGASFVAIAPLGATLAALYAVRLSGGPWRLVAIIALPVALGLIWLPMEQLLHDGLGLQIPAANSIRIPLAVSGWLPLIAAQSSTYRFYGGLGLAGAWVLSMIVALVTN